MPVPYARAGVEKTLATATCPAESCGEIFYGTTSKKAAAVYAKHYTITHEPATVDGLVDPTVVPEGTPRHTVYLLGRTEKTGLLTAGVDYGSGPFLFFLSNCCGAAPTYHDSDLCCKACWHDVPFDLDGEYSPRTHGAILPPTEADKATFLKGTS